MKLIVPVWELPFESWVSQERRIRVLLQKSLEEKLHSMDKGVLLFFLESKNDEDKWAGQHWLFVKIHAPLYLGKQCWWGQAELSGTLISITR